MWGLFFPVDVNHEGFPREMHPCCSNGSRTSGENRDMIYLHIGPIICRTEEATLELNLTSE